MQEIEVYNIIRQEIITNHSLMHWISLIVIIMLFTGCALIENRRSILSVFLPLIAPVWAATILRFDFFIHRQGAYLRILEVKLQEKGLDIPLWETWKAENFSGVFLIPLADFVIFLVIITITGYILFTHTPQYFEAKKWRLNRLYIWSILLLTIFLLSVTAFIPAITRI